MRSKIAFISLCLCLLTSISSYGQKSKVGYINTLELWELMPEKKEADSIMLIEKKDLEKYYNDQLKTINQKVAELKNDENFNPEDMIYQEKVSDIEEMSRKLDAFKQKAEGELQRKQNALYQPIKEKMQKAINEVAKKNDLEYVLDTSFNNIVYVKSEKFNLLPEVKSVLNLN